jgi:hypothetical protein
MKYIYSFILITFLFSQTSTLSLTGFGEYINTHDASSVGMADSKYFNGYPDRINFSSCSSYWKSPFSNLIMSIDVHNHSLESDNLVSNNFKMLSFSFPVGDNKAVSLGMNPLLRSNITVSEPDYVFIPSQNSPTGGPLAYNTDYSFKGGISEFFILYSSKLTDKISFGFKWSKLFGSSKYKYFLNLYNVSFDSNENISYDFNNIESFINNQKYSSDKYNIEFRYELKKYEFILSYSQANPLNISFTPYFDTLGLGDLNTENYYIDDNLYELDFGIKYKLNKNFGIVFENHFYNSFNSYDFLNILNNNVNNIKSNHLGIYSIDFKKPNSKINKSILRFGLYEKVYELNNYEIQDKGMTLGFGINYFDTKNFVDISFKFGNKNFTNNIYNDEDYYQIILSIVSGEKWFVNEREK